MEQYLKYILIASITVAVIAGLIILAYVAFWLKSYIGSRRVLRNGKNSNDFIYNLLRTTIPGRYIIRRSTIPLTQRPGDSRFVRTDIITVTRCGICVIMQKRMRGMIDNPAKGDWAVKTPDGGEVLFKNPFELNAYRVRAVEQILKREKIYNVPLQSIIVSTDKGARFRFKYDMLVTPDRLLTLIHDMDKNRFMTGAEMRRAASALKKHSRPL